MDPFLIILVLAFGAMWLMTSRTRKQQRQAADFRANLEVGQEVMTGSGLFGTIVDVDGDTITLESTPGNQTRWIRAAIAKLVEPAAEPVEDDLADDELVDDDADVPPATGSHGATRVEGIQIPDDLSTMNERRDDGTDPR
jgi:preprotein translocase subunit YajC